MEVLTVTKSEVIKEFFKKSVLPVAVAALLYCIFKSACTKDGVTDYVWLFILCGLPGTASLNARPRLVLAGLDPAAQYRDEENNTYTGAQLLTTGLELPGGYGQMPAKIWYLKKV